LPTRECPASKKPRHTANAVAGSSQGFGLVIQSRAGSRAANQAAANPITIHNMVKLDPKKET